MSDEASILFTAFEPSGDEHAATVIRHIRRIAPQRPVYALGGPKMAEAGAELIETTTENAVMGAGALARIAEHRAILRRLGQWWAKHPVAVHVPTDSPAANWSICKMAKAQSSRVAHLVAPQVWAWASWRVGRLKKWSDLVLCVLPFEPDWFDAHGVQAKFIGHPLYDEPLDNDELRWQSVNYPTTQPKLALLPGSRPGEVKRNWPVMKAAFNRLRQQRSDACAVVAVRGDRTATMVRQLGLPPETTLVVDQADAAIQWADVVLVTSGTATLHVTRQATPMVALYTTGALQWHGLARWLINTRTFTLPNLIHAGGPDHADRHTIREFVPYLGGAGGVKPIVDELIGLLEDSSKRQKQIESLHAINERFGGHLAGREAAEAILHLIEGDGPTEKTTD
jgi:lipid-A-disaccharide synthase